MIEGKRTSTLIASLLIALAGVTCGASAVAASDPDVETAWITRLRAHGNSVIVNTDEDGAITSVEIRGGIVDEADIAKLADFDALNTLGLAKLKAFSGMEDLRKLKSLRVLSFYSVPMQDKRLNALADLPQLENLSLNNSGVDVQQVRSILPKLTQLKHLGLSFTDVTAPDLKSLQSARVLVSLDLRVSEGIKDDIIPLLVSIPKLERVYLDATGVTREGIGQLRAARPELDIYVETTKG